MTKLKITTSALSSRITRKKIGNGTGIRIFKNNAGLQQSDNSFWSSAFKFVTSLFEKTFQILFSGISITFTTIWGFTVNALTQIYNFDWNVSDNSLNQSIVSRFNSLGSSFGSFAGASAGYLACGALPGAVVAYFNEPLGSLILQKVGEAALDELSGNFAALLVAIFEYIGQAALSFLYQNVRNFIRGTDLEFRRKLIDKGVKLADVEKAAQQRNKPFIFSQKVEEKVNQVNNEFAKNFLSSFLEQFGESCIEAGYVVAGTVDDYMARQRLSRDPLFGQEETLEVEIDSEDKVQVKKTPTLTKYKIQNL